MKVFIFLAIFFVAASAYKDDIYCPLCSDHIACGHSNTLSATCPKDARLVSLTAADKQIFLDVHNKYRNQVAGGNLRGFDSAVAMNTLVRQL
jgi:hypothetical protein